jgi:uncharacterized YigZ family protein
MEFAVESYTTVQKHSIFEYEDRKSVFIGEAAPASTEADALDFIAYIKKKYPDANHHVYAYVLRENSIMRFSDDREPQGTAGMPVLDIIRKNGCTDTVIVVTRYFGGTLLGTGGLVRAYGAAALGALKEANVITYDIYSDYRLTVSYSDYQKIMPVISDFGFRCSNTDYSDNIDIFGKIKKSQSEIFIKRLIETTSDRIKYKLIRECFDY